MMNFARYFAFCIIAIAALCACDMRNRGDGYADSHVSEWDSLPADTIAISPAKDSISQPKKEVTEVEKNVASSIGNYGSHYNSASETDDPEYRKGGKYDPQKYHTDYNRDPVSEKLRREYIDEDGYDADDDYDEYYGYGWRQY